MCPESLGLFDDDSGIIVSFSPYIVGPCFGKVRKIIPELSPITPLYQVLCVLLKE